MKKTKIKKKLKDLKWDLEMLEERIGNFESKEIRKRKLQASFLRFFIVSLLAVYVVIYVYSVFFK